MHFSPFAIPIEDLFVFLLPLHTIDFMLCVRKIAPINSEVCKKKIVTM